MKAITVGTTCQKWVKKTCVCGVALFVALTALPSAWAAGFNVNSNVTFMPLPSTYRTTTDTTGCPVGFAGKFSFTALLTNKPDSPAMPGVSVRVLTLTNGNVLLDPQTNRVLGGEGAVMQTPKVGQYGDGLLSAGEQVDIPFLLCLKTPQTFQFFVDVFGIVTKLVDVDRTGTDSGNFGSNIGARISADGRVVAFSSASTNLVANDANGKTDVFVRDLETGTTTLVSVNQAGTHGGNADSGLDLVEITPTGRFILFSSRATNLVATPTSGVGDLFVRDLQTGTTTLVSLNRNGTAGGNGESGRANASISADGRFVAYESNANDLVALPTSGSEVYVRDLQTGVTTLVSVSRTGTKGAGGSGGKISANGRFVLFSGGTDLVATPTSGGQLFVRDLQTATTALVSINRHGTAGGNNNSSRSMISDDGRFVVFVSSASDLVANDANGREDVFWRDLQTGTTSLVTINRAGTDSVNAFPTSMNFDTYGLLSANGRYVAFKSFAMDLIAIPVSGQGDSYIRDMQTGITTLVSINRTGTAGGNGGTSSPLDVTPDGRFVAFDGNSTDFVLNVSGGNVFLRDIQTGTTSLVNGDRKQTGGGNHGATNYARLSADRQWILFASESSDLVANDTNNQLDTFVRPIP